MLTNNYKVGVGILMESGGSSTYEESRTMVDVTGAEINTVKVANNNGNFGDHWFFRMMNNAILTGQMNTNGVIFGSGTGTADASDHKLSGELISGMAATSVSKVEVSGNAFVKTVVFTITNNNAEDKTIGEVGLINAFSVPNGNSYSSYFALLDHTYLDSPVTIPAEGGVGQVTYTLTLNIA